MNPERLIQHFEKIAEAPDAVPRLRRFILDLAVRGKLIEQDPGDEPAIELFKRIQAKKANLNKARKIQRARFLPPIRGNETPFPLPKSWLWVRLGDVLDYDAGMKTEPRQLPKDAWLLELEDIEKDSGRIIQRIAVAERSPKSTKSGFQLGDILYGKLRPYLNKAIVADSTGFSTTEIVALRPYGESVPHYTCLALRRPDFVDYVTRIGQGTKMPRLRTEDAVSALCPLPPLAEQHRIVAKVDELMVLCDELEAAQQKRDRRRDRLVAATLHGLNNGTSGEGLHQNARFYLNHFPRLTTRPEHIQQLRQTILNLAVQGKLVSQEPNDEPVSTLLERISDEQRNLVKQGLLKNRSVLCDARGDMEAPHAIPGEWHWQCLGNLISFGPQNGISPKPTNNEQAPKALTLTATTSGFFDPTHYKHVELREADCENYWLSSGDVLFQRGNTREYVGIAAVFNGPERSFIFPDLMIRVRFSESLHLRFVHMVLISPPLRNYFAAKATGASSSMPKISQGVLLNAPIPLPPLAEQHRIVAKVDELMALCDELEARLTASASTRSRLLEAVLHEALARHL
jgi:type I restriction enzyme, S subunit